MSQDGLLGMYMYLKQNRIFYFFFLLENDIFRYHNYKNEIISICWEPKSASYRAYTTLNAQCLGFLC